MSEQNNGGGVSSDSSSRSDSGLYGESWVPSPDDPNYAAYLKYQQNLEKASGSKSQGSTQGAAPSRLDGATDHKGVSSNANTHGNSGTGSSNEANQDASAPRFDDKGRPVNPDRPQQDNPNEAPSDYFMGPLAKPSHWSDKPNPDAPWWANPYTYVSKGEWRKPNWGTEPTDSNQEVEQPCASQGDGAPSSDGSPQRNASTDSRTTSGAQRESSGAEGSGASSAAGEPGLQNRGAWIPTGNSEAPWKWDATVQPNQTIDGKPCLVPQGAWVPSGVPSSPWRWDSSVLPNEYREGKPVYVPQGAFRSVDADEGKQSSPTMQSVWAGVPDLSKESGENRPDVPKATRIGWFFIGLVGGFLGLVFAWMVGSRYPQKQRKQVVRWCWAGFFCWCLIMFVIMGFNMSGGLGATGVGTDGGASASSSGAFD